jgi:hypothetical protein
MLELKDVTLCAVGSKDRLLTARALEISRGHCNFADSILFSHEPVEGSFRNVKIERPKSMAEYTIFMVKQMNNFISTPFALVTQWDGYVIDPSAWREEFLQYDYIGATWPWKVDNMKVGNGGFSLRSKRLLEIMSEPWFEILPNLGEDELICRAYRGTLEQKHQIRFAPPAVAERFSYERGIPEGPTFGFHGFFNFWREVPDADLIKMIPLIPPGDLQHIHSPQLLFMYYQCRRWKPLRALYAAWRANYTMNEVRDIILKALPPEVCARCLEVWEQLLVANS